jgi:hypothetical protein
MATENVVCVGCVCAGASVYLYTTHTVYVKYYSDSKKGEIDLGSYLSGGALVQQKQSHMFDTQP